MINIIIPTRSKNSNEIENKLFCGFLNSCIREKMELIATKMKRISRIISGILTNPKVRLNSLYNDFKIFG